jgi:alanine racemase
LNFKQLSSLAGVKILNQINNPEITSFVTDSRNISVSEKNSLFITIQRNNHDGHEFIKELYNKGIHSFLVERKIDPKSKLEVKICLSLLK